MLRRTEERGQNTIIFTLVLIPLLGLLGLVIDLGWAYYRRQAAQAAAEAAATAAVAAAVASGGTCGSNGVVCQATTPCPNPIPSPPTTNIHNGCLYARDNGFEVTQGGRQNVTMTSGATAPATAPGVNVGYWVTARVTETLPLTFSAVLGQRFATVSARATAASLPGGNGGCVYVLKPTGTSVTLSGTTLVQSGCGIYVNSNNSAAVLMSGSPRIVTTGGAFTNIVGGWLKSGDGTITPAPKLGVSVTPDPFDDMTMPTVGPCTSTGVTRGGSGSYALDPGVYCGAITISGSVALTLNPGLYVLKSGISMSGPTSISGSNVTIYNLSGAITMSGSGGITLTGATSGQWQGFVIIQPKSNTSAAALSGSSSITVNGVLYVPKATLTYSGGSSTNATSTTIVADSITFSGNAYIKNAATTAFGGGNGGIAMIE